MLVKSPFEGYDRGQTDKTEEGARDFVIACGDAPEAFEFLKEVLHEMSLSI